MQRALQLANQGRFSVAPNPRVGAVIVHDNKIIGEGYHAKFGEAHAEVNAIESVKNSALLASSTLYVTLEPCAHHGKTPPCVDLILTHRIPTVVLANHDPFNKVNGSGIEKLKQAGVQVILNVLAEEGRELNKRFFTFHEKKRPYIILKWAETADGFVSRQKAAIEGKNNWITNSLSAQLVHQWRAEEQGILVGRNTVEIDNPQLTCREFSGINPMRIILDPQLKLASSKRVFDAAAKTFLLNEKKNEMGEQVEVVKISFGNHFIEEFNAFCFSRQIQSVIIEGGSFTLNQFIEANNWDESRIFKGKGCFGSGLKAPSINGTLQSEEKIKEDILCIYRNPS